jgi:hypothetical protein
MLWVPFLDPAVLPAASHTFFASPKAMHRKPLRDLLLKSKFFIPLPHIDRSFFVRIQGCVIF